MKKKSLQIIEILKKNEETLRKFGVTHLSIFGSAARDEATQSSDLDFLVEFDSKSFDKYMELKFFLEELFSTHVDIVLRDNIKKRLRSIILNEALHVPGF